MHLLRRSAAALVRDPSLVIVALGFTTAQYLTGLKAGVLDIESPWWILTMAVILLGSPAIHAWLIVRSRALAGAGRASARAVWSQIVACFVRLLVGQIVVNALVIAGLAVFIIPGVYIGVRLIYYKQAIILDGLPVSGALYRSAELTVGWRTAAAVLARMVPIWAISFSVVAAATFFELGVAGDVLIIVGSAVSLAWVNALLTMSYKRAQAT